MSRAITQSTIVVENQTRNCVVAGHVLSAEDSATRRRGLLKVKDLAPDSGLWIHPCEAIHTFGMQINLDVVFLDNSLCVRKIVPSLKPNRIAFCLTARSVLEIRAGVAAESGLQRGDRLVLHWSRHSIAPEDSIR